MISMTERTVRFDELLRQMREIQEKKGRDYGEEEDGLKNLRRRGQQGVIMRMGDKLSRLETLTKPGRTALVEDESVEDTCLDLANYCLLFIILRES
jgi:hypothetical protein